jgi:hypothetical protein
LLGGVLALQLFEGEIYAGCSDGIVARWDGTEWVNVGSSLSSSVLALEVFNGQLYAGGIFASRVARWNGTTWVASGQGLASRVQDLAVFNGELYAAGWFNGGVAKWNGSSWNPVGSDIADNCYVLAEFSGSLHVGGDGGLKRLMGGTWENLGTQIGAVRTLTKLGPTLVVGGLFTQAGGHESRGIAVWQELFVDEDLDPELESAASLRAWPNPFASTCTIELQESAGVAGTIDAGAGRGAHAALDETAQRTAVPIEIFDIAGRRVKLISSETSSDGILRWHWNGDDDRGQSAAAGVYFVRFPDGRRSPLKILRVR